MILTITVRPFFVRLPDDVIGRVGGEARLHCRAGGSPAPHVTWRRHDGRMPVSRARIVDRDHALTIVALQTSDDGEYFCQAENEVATVVARARLNVLGKILLMLPCIIDAHFLPYFKEILQQYIII